jgi:hypothetical protein
MFKKYSGDIHTTFKKKSNHIRNMFTKLSPHLESKPHSIDEVDDKKNDINDLERK